MDEKKVTTEEFRVTGDALVGVIRTLLHEGNVRRITLRNEEGKTLIEIPLTIGVVGVLLLPVWAAVGAIAALAANLTIIVEKVGDDAATAAEASASAAGQETTAAAPPPAG